MKKTYEIRKSTKEEWEVYETTKPEVGMTVTLLTRLLGIFETKGEAEFYKYTKEQAEGKPVTMYRPRRGKVKIKKNVGEIVDEDFLGTLDKAMDDRLREDGKL